MGGTRRRLDRRSYAPIAMSGRMAAGTFETKAPNQCREPLLNRPLCGTVHDRPHDPRKHGEAR